MRKTLPGAAVERFVGSRPHYEIGYVVLHIADERPNDQHDRDQDQGWSNMERIGIVLHCKVFHTHTLKHNPEECEAAFQKDHAQTKGKAR
ncbi:hypothetical protein [Bradyrhizobium sp.]|uniref:hypothetical protein n=1 Tax=Bradyrhizobium sp. TaxID=376 RepID=UPI004037655D